MCLETSERPLLPLLGAPVLKKIGEKGTMREGAKVSIAVSQRWGLWKPPQPKRSYFSPSAAKQRRLCSTTIKGSSWGSSVTGLESTGKSWATPKLGVSSLSSLTIVTLRVAYTCPCENLQGTDMKIILWPQQPLRREKNLPPCFIQQTS